VEEKWKKGGEGRRDERHCYASKILFCRLTGGGEGGDSNSCGGRETMMEHDWKNGNQWVPSPMRGTEQGMVEDENSRELSKKNFYGKGGLFPKLR